ncbi:MAG TPA: helix-turn-helix transcriptional regulator [Baekduia sp.]
MSFEPLPQPFGPAADLSEVADAPPRRRLRPVEALPPVSTTEDGTFDLAALADLVAAPDVDVAARARAALSPLLPHDALVLVTPASAGLPVQIAAPPGQQKGLASIDWRRAAEQGATPDGAVTRIKLADIAGNLTLVGWRATLGAHTASLILAARGRLNVDAAAERAAMLVAMLAAARARRVDQDPGPGTLAFSRAVSQERERVRAELNSRHAATLSGLLQILRGASWAGGSRSAPPAVTEAIDQASYALLDLEALNELHDEADRVAIRGAFEEVEREVRGIVHASRVQVLADLDARDEFPLPRAIAQAARLATARAALCAARAADADKLRILWRMTPKALVLTIADNGAGMADTGWSDMVGDIERRIGGLGAECELDARTSWGTTLTCRIPLHDLPASPETPSSKRIAELRDREREVLELMIAGLRNREIAERMFISVRTVKFHVSNVLRKLDVDSRTAAIAAAHAAGISANVERAA